MTALLYKDLWRSADLIFVLAGRKNRKEYGLELFRQGVAPKILLSVGRYEIRRFSQLSLPVPVDLLKLTFDVPPPERHFFVLFESRRFQVEHIRPGRFGTLTEIEALARWLGDHPQIRSLLIISSSAHLRRIRICCKSLLSSSLKTALISVPGTSSGEQEFESLAAVLVERMKRLLYCAILGLRLDRLRPIRKHRSQRT